MHGLCRVSSCTLAKIILYSFFLSFLFFFVASSATAYVYGLKAARLSGCKPPAHVIDVKAKLNTE